jgi:F-type H+-transporting ATPase subunit delta
VAAKTTLTSGVAGRYAAALFDLAKDAGELDSINDDLTALRDLIRESSDLANVVRSPILSRDMQEKAIMAVLEKAGAKPLTKQFVGVIARNRRLFALPDMIEAYRAMLADFRGEVTAEVTSAQALSTEQISELSETLSRELRKTVQIDASVDEGLLGGLVVRVGSRMIDNSLRTKLSNMQLAMKGVG